MMVRDELRPAGEVHTVFARMRYRRGRNAHVHFGRTSFFDEIDEGLGGRATHDRIVHHNNLLVLEHTLYGVEFHFDFHFAPVLTGLDERAAHIVRADKADLILRLVTELLILARITKCCGVRRVRDVDHRDLLTVRVLYRRFDREAFAKLTAHTIDVLFEDLTVRSCEVDILENAMGRLWRVLFEVRRANFARLNGMFVDNDDLVRLHVPNVFVSDNIERAGLRGDHVGILTAGKPDAPDSTR